MGLFRVWASEEGHGFEKTHDRPSPARRNWKCPIDRWWPTLAEIEIERDAEEEARVLGPLYGPDQPKRSRGPEAQNGYWKIESELLCVHKATA